jgi:hypothetical protein
MAENPEMSRTFDHDPTTPPPPGVVIIPAPPPAPRRRLWPAAVLMVLALGLLGYRLSIADWHWEWPWEGRAPAALAAPAAPLASEPGPREFVGPPRPETLVEVEPRPADETPALARAQSEAATPAEAASAGEPEKPADDPAALALSDIEKEAERIRKEREELQKAKEEAGKEIAAAPRRSSPFGAFPNPALLARQQREMEAIMRRQMQEHRRAMERMLRAQRGLGARGRMPGEDDRFDRVFEQMRREMEAFEREAEAMMREQRAFAFGMPARRGVQLPPAPDLDVPAPPEPELHEGAGGAPDNADRPRVQRRRFVTPDGTQVETFEMRWGFADR